MNKKYMQAEVEIIVLNNNDVITTSGDQGGLDMGDDL